jgi:L-threonylcarbamoyladenylate synthase
MPAFNHRNTRIMPATEAAVREAVVILRGGGLVVFPTETVYGLGADALNPAAVRDMFRAKGRPADHPVIVHLAEPGLMDRFAVDVPEAARQLAAAFWPGPLTMVLNRSREISDLVTGGLETVGLRVPGHPVARSLLREFAGPIAAPSANPFGRVSATRAEHVLAELNGRIDLILDGGPCEVGLESTIVDLASPHPAVLRPGAITVEQIAAVLQTEVQGATPSSPKVSGNLPSHYAPRARVELVSPDALLARARELAEQGAKVAVLTTAAPQIDSKHIILLMIHGSEADSAKELYNRLRTADELGCDVVLTTLPAEMGLGTAIADRLRRAAGPRPTG